MSKIRLLGDSQHSAKIAFIEFVTAESARAALKLSSALLGTLPLQGSKHHTFCSCPTLRAPPPMLRLS